MNTLHKNKLHAISAASTLENDSPKSHKWDVCPKTLKRGNVDSKSFNPEEPIREIGVKSKTITLEPRAGPKRNKGGSPNPHYAGPIELLDEARIVRAQGFATKESGRGKDRDLQRFRDETHRLVKFAPRPRRLSRSDSVKVAMEESLRTQRRLIALDRSKSALFGTPRDRSLMMPAKQPTKVRAQPHRDFDLVEIDRPEPHYPEVDLVELIRPAHPPPSQAGDVELNPGPPKKISPDVHRAGTDWNARMCNTQQNDCDLAGVQVYPDRRPTKGGHGEFRVVCPLCGYNFVKGCGATRVTHGGFSFMTAYHPHRDESPTVDSASLASDSDEPMTEPDESGYSDAESSVDSDTVKEPPQGSFFPLSEPPSRPSSRMGDSSRLGSPEPERKYKKSVLKGHVLSEKECRQVFCYASEPACRGRGPIVSWIYHFFAWFLPELLGIEMTHEKRIMDSKCEKRVVSNRNIKITDQPLEVRDITYVVPPDDLFFGLVRVVQFAIAIWYARKTGPLSREAIHDIAKQKRVLVDATISYVPHIVSEVAFQFPRNTTPDVARANIHMKIGRLATLPIKAKEYLHLTQGSGLAVEAYLKYQHFF